jgi:hypothetical protein
MQVGGYFVYGLLVSTEVIMNDTRNPMRPLEPILYAGIDYNFRPDFYWATAANPPDEYSPDVRFITGNCAVNSQGHPEASRIDRFGHAQ